MDDTLVARHIAASEADRLQRGAYNRSASAVGPISCKPIVLVTQ